MTLVDHFRIILQNWWRILLVSVVVAGGVYVLVSQQSKEYSASTFLSVTSGRSDLSGAAAKDQTVFLASTYARLATTKPVAREAAKRSGLHISADTAQSRLSASAAADLGFITLASKGPSPSNASKLANAGASALIAEVNKQQTDSEQRDTASVRTQLQSLQAQLDAIPVNSPQRASLEARYDALLQVLVQRETQPNDRVAVVSAATPPGSPQAPEPLRDALLGFVVALVIASESTVGLWLLSDRFSRTADADDIRTLTGLPVLGTIPRGASGSQIREAYRALRTNLFLLPEGRETRTFAIVSANENAGKSFTSLHLSEAVADSGTDAVLIDADLRKPVIHEWTGIPREPGLTNALAERPLFDTLTSVDGQSRLRVLPSGRAVPDPAAVLSGRAFARLIDALEEDDCTVVVDTPPIGLVSDGIPVAAHCDATIFVLDVTTSRRRDVRSALESLRRAGTHLVGVVANRTPVPRGSTYYRHRETPREPAAQPPATA